MEIAPTKSSSTNTKKQIRIALIVLSIIEFVAIAYAVYAKLGR